MNYKKILSYIASFIVFISTAIIMLMVFRLDTSGRGITTGEFMPIRNSMLILAIPAFIKFYISGDREYKESKLWLIGYLICVVMWAVFILFAFTSAYFTNIRTMCGASFVLVIMSAYIEYLMVKDK